MAQTKLEGRRVAILVTNDFEQVELTSPKQALEQAGARPVIVAPKAGQVQGMNHDVKADTFKVDQTLAEARPEDFDALLLPGGALNADNLRVEKAAQEFVTKMQEAGKPIAFICHAPWLLVSARLVSGRRLTSYHTIQDDIRNAGGQWVDQEVVRDVNWVSSRSPQDLPAFNQAMLALFAGGTFEKAATSASEVQSALDRLNNPHLSQVPRPTADPLMPGDVGEAWRQSPTSGPEADTEGQSPSTR